MSLCPLSPLQTLPTLTTPCAPTAAAAADGGFERVLNQVLSGATTADAQAAQAVQDLATGEADDLHTAALAVAQADLSFRLALAVRNRLLEAYQEIIRLQV